MRMLRGSVRMAAMLGVLAGACSGGNDGGGRDGGPRIDAPATPIDAPAAAADAVAIDAPARDAPSPAGNCRGPAGTGECDVIAQDCGGTNGCYFASTSAGAPPMTLCAAAGTGADGDACTAIENCQPGLFCDPIDDVCRHYCCMGTPCPSGQICIPIAEAAGIGTCQTTDGCALVPQSGCGAEQGCWPVGGDGSTSCFSAGSTPVGGACATLNGCVPGAGCYGMGGGGGMCVRFCRIGMDADCMGMGTCRMQGAGLGLPAGVGLCT